MKQNFLFRRNKVTLEDLVKRFVRHGTDVFEEADSNAGGFITQENWQTISRIYTLLLKVIKKNQSYGQEELRRCQDLFCKCGAVRFTIETMMKRPESKIVQQAMELSITMLEPWNGFVQKTYEACFYEIDDSGLWAVFSDIYDQVASNVTP